MTDEVRPRRVLGLDLGTRCGWALATSAEVDWRQSGVWELKAGRGRLLEQVKLGPRMLELRRRLEEARATHVFYEEVHRHLGTSAAHVFGALRGVVEMYCLEAGALLLGFQVQAVKRRATGYFNAQKEHMQWAAQRQFGMPETPAEDQADALWVLQCGLDVLALDVELKPGRVMLHGHRVTGRLTARVKRLQQEGRERRRREKGGES